MVVLSSALEGNLISGVMQLLFAGGLLLLILILLLYSSNGYTATWWHKSGSGVYIR